MKSRQESAIGITTAVACVVVLALPMLGPAGLAITASIVIVGALAAIRWRSV